MLFVSLEFIESIKWEGVEFFMGSPENDNKILILIENSSLSNSIVSPKKIFTLKLKLNWWHHWDSNWGLFGDRR